MELHKTQCPHCFTTYVISDEQFRVSQGMVRCGTCRERFQARLNSPKETPRFDPRKAFIEPISEEISAQPIHEPEEPQEIEFTDPHTESIEIQEISYGSSLEASINSELTIEMEDDELEEPVDSEHLDEALIRENIEAKQAKKSGIESKNFSSSKPSSSSQSSEKSEQIIAKQRELELPQGPNVETPTPPSIANRVSQLRRNQIAREQSTTAPSLDDNKEAPQGAAVDQPGRIAPTLNTNQTSPNQPSVRESALERPTTQESRPALEKPEPSNSHEPMNSSEPINSPELLKSHELLKSPELRKSPQAQDSQQFKQPNSDAPNGNSQIDSTPIVPPNAIIPPQRATKLKRRFFRAMLALLVFFPAAIALSAALGYQLWHKQLLVFPAKSKAEKLILSTAIPFAEKLSERGIALPVRRNLSKLKLISARTEAHPTRPSTTLLRISLLSNASITQPLPWMELSLTNPEGRLVARRQLSPQDYLYNNTTTAQIGPKELKKITIELLAFPKQAEGFELKLLNK